VTDATDDSIDEVPTSGELPEAAGILSVRHGPGANCSSIGSAVEILFLSATAGAAILAAVAAVLRASPTASDAAPDSATTRSAAGTNRLPEEIPSVDGGTAP